LVVEAHDRKQCGKRCTFLVADADPFDLAARERICKRIERVSDQPEDMLGPDLFAEKILAADAHTARRSTRLVEVDRHDSVGGFAFARAVFAHPDPAPPHRVDHGIAEAEMMFGAQWRRRQRFEVRVAGALAVQACCSWCRTSELAELMKVTQ
jgi:hypothetical protein